MKSESLTRREFLNRTAGTATGAATASAIITSKAPAAGGSGKFVIGMMGTGGRGNWLLGMELAKRPEVEIAYVCDVDSRADRLGRAVKIVEDGKGRKPKAVTDFRRILDDKNVDALFICTPDHWHALPTVLACQAGKDVFVEKPASHNVWEGRKMVEAARKHKRIVQLGTQCRSAPYIHKAIEYIRSGKLGDIHLVRVLNMKRRYTIGREADGPVPEGVNYDWWLGPAPKRPFNPNRFHYRWHWCWDYSGGDIINDGVHQIDLARWLVNKGHPKSVTSGGGMHFYDDDHETPDTQIVTWEYDKLTMVFELTLWTPYMKKTQWNFRDTDQFPNWRYSATKVEVYGTKGLMMMSRHGGGWQVFDADGKEVASAPGRHPHSPHLDNFFECVESRKQPSADIEDGHISTVLCHLGNISYRLGGRKLLFDGKSEKFINDNEANMYLKRVPRKPWVIPEKV
ncbi:MAG: Gfo/Idh/MocA family oxidoreductase [Planctomycetota bacterium]|nr:MAG: Gfo/Idh/MocA family oxidoreductase [Planctomycetota bacterium]